MWPLLIGPISQLFNTVLTRVLPPEKMGEAERARIESELLLAMSKMDWQATEAQLQVNLEQAKHPSLFIAGARPFIMWVCGVALAYHFVLQPLLVFVITIMRWQTPPLPSFDMNTLMTVLLGLLGLGGMRSFEKLKGVVGSH